MNLYHPDDPSAAGLPLWNYVYLHGEAEDRNEAAAGPHGWDFAHDCFVCDAPLPTQEGEYRGTLYGTPVVAVLRVRHGHMSGRVAIDEPNAESYAHVFSPQDWR